MCQVTMDEESGFEESLLREQKTSIKEIFFDMTWCFRASIQLPKGQLSFVESWPVMNPNDLAFLLITYLMFVLKVGPYIMKNRRPLKMKRFLVAYDAAKVVISASLCHKFFTYIMDNGLFPRSCEYDDSTIYRIAILYWKYMVTKIIDLFDTVFFILFKKDSQVTFLHVYHHVFMVIISWSCLKYDPSDHWAYMAFMNTAIHTAMYTYYGISALGPKFLRLLWWKKYLTIMQMIQFVLIICHMIIQTYTSKCPIHAGSYWIGLGNTTFFILLFADFYIKRYRSKSTERALFSCSTL